MKAKTFEKDYTLAVAICNTLDDNKAENIALIDISNQTDIADYFIIATANSTVHNKSLVDKIEETCENLGQKVIRRDGISDGRWMVLDYGTLIIHLFTPELREFYHLEKIWNDGKNTLNIQGIKKLAEKQQLLDTQKDKDLDKEKQENQPDTKENSDTKAKESSEDSNKE